LDFARLKANVGYTCSKLLASFEYVPSGQMFFYPESAKVIQRTLN